MKNYIKYFGLFFLLITLYSCNSKTKKIDLSDDGWKTYELIRLEKTLFNDDINQLHQKFSNYPELYQNFYSKMIRAGSKEEILVPKISNSTHLKLEQLKNDSIILQILKEIQVNFSNFEYYKAQISKGLQRYESLFGKTYRSKKIGTFFSLFNADVHEFDSIIWIGLDMYLGPESKIIKQLPSESLPNYIKEKMDKKYIVSDVLFGFLMTHRPQYLGDDFLSKLLSYGKICYLMDLVLPDEESENKFRYNKKELKWCEENEKYIWQYIIDHELLYEKDYNKFNYFFNPGPYTKNFGVESPAHIGIWLGYRIIEDYVSSTNLNINEILQEKNIQKLLSTYEPR